MTTMTKTPMKTEKPYAQGRSINKIWGVLDFGEFSIDLWT